MTGLSDLLKWMEGLEASDLHIKVGTRPRYRIHGQLLDVPRTSVLTRAEVERLMHGVLTREEDRLFLLWGRLDFGYRDSEAGRFRCRYFQDRNGPAAVFRRIPPRVPELMDLNLPAQVGLLADARDGLVLFSGTDGSGKTSTMASVLEVVNAVYRRFIITLERPIEFVHKDGKSVIQQRGVPYDIADFATGIEEALQTSPDMLVIGDLPDAKTMRLALAAAGVGIVTFAVIRAHSASAAIDRIIGSFDADERPAIRSMLSQSLAGVVSQVLLLRTDGTGRVPAAEILQGTAEVSDRIRTDKIREIPDLMRAGDGGTQTLDSSLESLVEDGIVDPGEAYVYARDKERFGKLRDKMKRESNP
ncbi:MAG: type IV pilus twitching motility protein PilT [Planctomycetota bacterium]|jgi:twitching motility protein PilT